MGDYNKNLYRSNVPLCHIVIRFVRFSRPPNKIRDNVISYREEIRILVFIISVTTLGDI